MKTNEIKTQWQYLEERPEFGLKQLYFKGKKLKAFTAWMDMIVNSLTEEEIADNKDLPLAAVLEAIKYCQANQQILEQEAQKERRYLEERGVILEPKVTH